MAKRKQGETKSSPAQGKTKLLLWRGETMRGLALKNMRLRAATRELRFAANSNCLYPPVSL